MLMKEIEEIIDNSSAPIETEPHVHEHLVHMMEEFDDKVQLQPESSVKRVFWNQQVST